MNVCFNDEEASPEELESDEEDEDEDNERREPNEQDVREGAVVEKR